MGKNIFSSLLVEFLEKNIEAIFDFAGEVLNGSGRYAVEESAIQEAVQNLRKEKNTLFTQLIFSVRNFLLALVGFSLTIIGVVLGIVYTGRAAGNETIIYMGLFFLSANVVGSVVYILYIHTIEINWLKRSVDFDNSAMEQLRKVLNNNRNGGKSFKEYIKEKEKTLSLIKKQEEETRYKNPLLYKGKDWFPHILSGLFLVGLLFLFFAFH